ncbi:MAG TPA: CHRD domain-containing protein [Pyrinomonadaceae bacterium]|nr:CHRD domain-containing protein [Pyrinomonadaceae bacterium]
MFLLTPLPKMRWILPVLQAFALALMASTALAQTTTLVSVNSSGTATANGLSQVPVISADGRFVAFVSNATDLSTTPDNNNTSDVFVRDLQTNTSKLVTINSPGTATGNNISEAPVISADGRFVAFASRATDLVTSADNNNNVDIFVRDLQTNTTKLVSVNSTGNATGNNSSSAPVISADGRFVVFESTATDLATITDNNNMADIFVRDLQTGTTRVVSVNGSGNATGNSFSSLGTREAGAPPVISTDGRFVLFESQSTDLVVTSDNNNDVDVFVRDLLANTTRLVSVNNSGTATGNFRSAAQAINSDGHFVVFGSYSTDLVITSDNNQEIDVFVRDLQMNTTKLVSITSSGTATGNGGSGRQVALSADGRFVAFDSAATDLVTTSYNNNESETFLRDLQTNTTRLVSINSTGTGTGNHNSGLPVMSADGRFVAFASFATNLVTTPDNNDNIDIFVRDLQMNTTKLASINSSGTATGNNFSVLPVISADGRFVAFTSIATDLVTTPENNNNRDVFVFGPLAAPARSVQFISATFSVDEGAGSATLTVTRTGDTSAPATVEFTSGNNVYTPCNVVNGAGAQNCDFIVSAGTLMFNANETSKTLRVLLVEDAYVEGNETFPLTLGHPTGAALGNPSTCTVTITDNDTASASSVSRKQFIATLTGTQEVPATGNTIKGNSGLVKLSTDETSAGVSLIFSGLTGSQTGAHIHGPAAAGTNANILFQLPLGSPLNNFQIGLLPQQVADLKEGLHYINVHSTSFPDGEIRGQLLWNPIEETSLFISQQYLDFHSRLALDDSTGLAYWINEIDSCNADALCIRERRIRISDAFFFEQEFQKTAGYVHRLYRAAYGNNQPFPNPDAGDPASPYYPGPDFHLKFPSYAIFGADRARLDASDLTQTQLALANEFVQRPEFVQQYPANLSKEEFVDEVLKTIAAASGSDLNAQKATLNTIYDQGGRGLVMFHLANDYWNGCPPGMTPCVPQDVGPAVDNRQFIDAEYNMLFVTSEYVAYLRRDGDANGLNFWLRQVNRFPPRSPEVQHAMVCSFITSAEYQLRFGGTPTRNNGECPQ